MTAANDEEVGVPARGCAHEFLSGISLQQFSVVLNALLAEGFSPSADQISARSCDEPFGVDLQRAELNEPGARHHMHCSDLRAQVGRQLRTPGDRALRCCRAVDADQDLTDGHARSADQEIDLGVDQRRNQSRPIIGDHLTRDWVWTRFVLGVCVQDAERPRHRVRNRARRLAVARRAKHVRNAFLAVLPLLAVSSLLLMLARHHYPGEVAAARQSTNAPPPEVDNG
jgi:hypothetical protein